METKTKGAFTQYNRFKTDINDKYHFVHHLMLLSIFVCKWILPNSKVSRDELSQVLFVFIGAALDIIEFVTETRKVY